MRFHFRARATIPSNGKKSLKGVLTAELQNKKKLPLKQLRGRSFKRHSTISFVLFIYIYIKNAREA